MRAPFDAPPLDPSSAEARRWLQEELAKGGYLTNPSWWQRFLEWLRGLVDGPAGGAVPSWVAVTLLVVLLALAGLVVARVVRPEAVTKGRSGRGSAAVDDEGLAAAGYRRRAEAAAARGDWDALLLDSYRALAAGAVERTLLTELPGRTAHEVAVSLSQVFPAHADALALAATSFDEVRYGHRATTQAQAVAVAELDAALLRARPRLDQLATT